MQNTETSLMIWAIDPFDKETLPNRASVQTLINGLRSSQFELLPVHILSVPRTETAPYLEGGGPLKYIEASEVATEEYLRNLGIQNHLPVEVLVDDSSAEGNASQKLNEYADRIGADCIAVSSHGRRGIQRLFFGSFSERLVQESAHPVLFFSSEPKEPVESRRRVLFPTDFSEDTKRAFLKFLPLAKKFGFDISLFHSVTLPTEALLSDFGVPLTEPDQFFSRQMAWANETGQQWVKLAAAQGVTVHPIISNDGVGAIISETILGAARNERVALIAMGFLGERPASFISESVARDVIRSHRYPVWVYGKKSLRT